MTDIQISTSQQALLDEIREKVMVYLKIEHAPKEKQDEVLAQLGETAFQKVLLALLERLDEAGQTEYEALLDREASPEETDAFLHAHIADYEEVVRRTMDELMQRLVTSGDEA